MCIAGATVFPWKSSSTRAVAQGNFAHRGKFSAGSVRAQGDLQGVLDLPDAGRCTSPESRTTPSAADTAIRFASTSAARTSAASIRDLTSAGLTTGFSAIRSPMPRTPDRYETADSAAPFWYIQVTLPSSRTKPSRTTAVTVEGTLTRLRSASAWPRLPRHASRSTSRRSP